MTRLTVLGPQRRPTLDVVVREVVPEGTIATCTAGWLEREPDDDELDSLLGGRGANLELYGRWLDVQEKDPEFAAADRHRREVRDELQAAYVLRLEHEVAAVLELLRRDLRLRVVVAVLDDAIASVAALDARQLELIAEVDAEAEAAIPAAERPVIVEHRAAVARTLTEASGVAIAGGNVDALLHSLKLFAVGNQLAGKQLIAWSAGAMALTERVVLFNDRAPDARSYAEVYDAGLGVCRGAVMLPHARRRLTLDDPLRVLLFARRFAPAACVVLDDGDRLDWPDEGGVPPHAEVLTTNGQVLAAEELAA